MRTITALAVATGLAFSLAACGTSATSAGSCEPTATSGDASSIVTATGQFGTKPTVSFPTPLVSADIEVSTVSAGSGTVLKAGDVADVQATVLDSKTGEVLTSSSYSSDQPLRRSVGDTTIDSIGVTLECATIGSRIAATMTVSDLFGEQGIDPSYGLGAEDTLVLVIDIEDGYLGKANGADQLPQAGFPSVALAPDGQPGLTIPNETAPTDLKIAVLKQGDGAAVAADDDVVVHYSEFVWDSRTQVESSWERGVPATFTTRSLDAADGTGLIEGLAKALIGQKVGSQVIAVIPPKFGYPEGSLPSGVPAGSTLIYVLDVLGIEK